MHFDEAAEHLVSDYKSVTQPSMSGFNLIISLLCYLYPAAPAQLVVHEVVRKFSKAKPLGR